MAEPADGGLEDRAAVREAALRIDRQVAGWFRMNELEVPEVTDDATFLRRAFLVAIGRIPTMSEAKFFLAAEGEGKREGLIDHLLESPGYHSHMTNWAFDLVRVRDRKPGFGGNFEPYRAWVREAIADNMPWDEFTSKLLASSGDGWDPQSAAVGYYVRDRGMALDNMANTMRVFLGSRIECAQCHDDPFGNTERLDFYEMAAFTHGQRPGRRGLMGEIWREVRQEDMRGSLEHQVARILWNQVYGQSLRGGGTGRIKLPDDYQYRDGDPGEWVGARTPFGETLRMSDRRNHGDGRKKLADWVTTHSEGAFASVIANRMWERVMGRGVYEPIDEYVPASETHLPELMDELVSLMHELNFDLREFQRVLLSTKTFQFAPNPEGSLVAGSDDFHGRKLARLSAEQIWDSLITLAVGDPDQKPRRTLDDRIRVRGKPVLVGKKTMSDLSREVLALKSKKEVREYFDDLVEQVRGEIEPGEEAAQAEGGASMMSVSDATMMEDGGATMMSMSPAPTRYGARATVRASELPSPAPRNHLLFLFGQADRETIGSASAEPNVGQVLSLMNGYVQDRLVRNRKASIFRSLKDADSPEEKIRRIYLAILSRPPSGEEMGWMLEEIEASGEQAALGNIVSALVMSSEFLFLQ